MKMLETSLILDLVIGLHWSPEVVVRLKDWGVRPQRVGGHWSGELPSRGRVNTLHGQRAARGGVAGAGAGRDVEVLRARPLALVVRIIKLPASERGRGGRHWVPLPSRHGGAGLFRLGSLKIASGKCLVFSDN